MSERKWTAHELPLSLGRVTTATLGGDVLYLIRHRDMATYRLEGDAVTEHFPPVSVHQRIQLDERNLHVAVDPKGTVFVLLGDGSIWRREGGADLVLVTPPDVRLAGHYAHRTGFVFDVTAARLVVAGGDERNDGYTVDIGSGDVALLPYGPGHGVGQTVATPRGVYRLVGGDLWLLRGQSWAFVERHAYARRDAGELLFWSPNHDALFFVSEVPRRAPTCVELTSDGPNPPVKLDGSFASALEAHGYFAQVEPKADRLWCTDHLGARYLPLALLGLEGGPPVRGRDLERSVVTEPPSHWYREALGLRQRDDEAPELGVTVRDGWILAATLPASPHLPLGDAGALLLFSRAFPYDYDPWTLAFLNAFEARLVDEVYPPTAGGMSLEMVPFSEVDPVFATRVDTAADGSTRLARGSKIGGFPALVSGTREAAANAFVAEVQCEDCESRLRFVAQLAWPEWDLISAVVYVYACPFGHSAAAYAQNV